MAPCPNAFPVPHEPLKMDLLMELAEAVLVTSWLNTEDGIRRAGVLTDHYPLKPLSPVQERSPDVLRVQQGYEPV